MKLRDRLAAIFSPTRKLTDLDGGILRAGGAWGGVEWIVPRARCHFLQIDLTAVGEKHRLSAATLAVKRAYPEAGCQHYIAGVDGMTLCWIWKTSEVLEDRRTGVCLPESILIPPSDQDGSRLVQAVRGFEGQVWRQRQLLASRWWPELPTATQWRFFLRSAGIGGEAGSVVPEVTHLPLSDRPWGMAGSGRLWSSDRLEAIAWPVVVAFAGLVIGWQIAASTVWAIGSARVQKQLDELRLIAAPVLEARERAQADLETLQSFRALQSGYSDYALAAAVVEPLPAGVRILAWSRVGNQLRVLLESEQTDPRVFVSAFQSSSILLNARATPTPQQKVELQFDLPTDHSHASGAAP